MAQQYDLLSGLDISSLSSVTQSQLLQMINNAAPLSNIGGIICFDGLSAGAAGVGFPDVTNNARFVRYIWLDTNPGGTSTIDRSSPVFKRYVGTYTGTPANPSGMSNLYTDWVAVGVASGAITTAMLAARSATGGVDIGKLKRASDGSADAGKQFWVVRVDSSGQYIEVVSLDTLVADAGGLSLARLQTSGIGANKYLGVTNGALAYRYLDPANDFSSALGNRIPASSAIAPGSPLYLLRTNGAASACEWVATNASDLFAAGDIALTKLAAGGAAANDILKWDGSAWVKVGMGAHINAMVNTYYPGTLLSNATPYIETGALSGQPKLFKAVVVKVGGGTDASYADGDEVDFDSLSGYDAGPGDTYPIVGVLWNAASSKLRVGWYPSPTTNTGLPDKTTFVRTAINKALWAPKIYYWL